MKSPRTRDIFVAVEDFGKILDPKNCTPVDTEISSVTVVVDGNVENCGTVADILSTTVFVMGKERVEKILSEQKTVAKIL